MDYIERHCCGIFQKRIYIFICTVYGWIRDYGSLTALCLSFEKTTTRRKRGSEAGLRMDESQGGLDMHRT